MQNSKNLMVTIMIVQIVLQLILKQSVDTIIDMLLAMQVLVYIMEFNLNMPALVEMLLNQFKSLIQFDAINPESFAKMVLGNDFTFYRFITGSTQTIVDEDQKVSMMSDLMVYIFSVIVFLSSMLIMGLLYLVCTPAIKTKIKAKALNVKKHLIWNDLIISYRVAHFAIAISAGAQFKLRLKDSQFSEPMNFYVAVSAFAAMGVFIIYISGYLLYHYDKLPEKRERIGMLYPNVTFMRDRMFVLRYPLFMLHRMLYVLYACVFFTFITLAIQLLIITTLAYTMFRFAYPPSLPRS